MRTLLVPDLHNTEYYVIVQFSAMSGTREWTFQELLDRRDGICSVKFKVRTELVLCASMKVPYLLIILNLALSSQWSQEAVINLLNL